MRLLDLALAPAVIFGRGVNDSGRVASFVRHTLRGNRIAPSLPCEINGHAQPLMLLHGYLATRGSLAVLESRLSQQGHVVFTCLLGPVHVGDIRTSAERVARRVESVLEQTGLQRLDLVGHSMGGLVGLYYLKRLGGHRRLRRLGLLGTPAAGTWSALLGLLTTPFGKGSSQLLPNSAFIEELSSDPLPPDVEVFTIAGKRDWLVPTSATYLAGVRRICLPTNHAGLLFDDQVADSLGAILREGDKGRASGVDNVAARR